MIKNSETVVGDDGYDVAIPSAKALYIEMRFGDTILSSGTAFLVSRTRESHCALITNRHNLTGRHQESGQCLSSTAAIPDHIDIYFLAPFEDRPKDWNKVSLPLYRENGSPYWIEHPRLKERADIVALNFTWGNDVHKLPYYIDTTLDRHGIVVGPAEPVSVIGYPFGRTSVAKFPIWATGFLAHELSLVTAENPTFMIDCRTRQGQSGSAVIAWRVGNYRKLNAEGGVVSVVSPGPHWEFLGIYSGRIHPHSDIGKVWHVSAIAELLDAAALDAQERAEKGKHGDRTF
ncbi:hypothetical protein FHW58_003200 [Duganella sp. 1224]|uniref:serine protease n=1 Tax=Duganella sp. 1224 TaxID=2587052 RepID=UPI0015CB8D8A|nr:serine protease [Duganella sp. 1224]NYE61993.1 hypothetical protein [Duganella sp. 1224]